MMSTGATSSSWEDLLPAVRGRLPNGTRLRRTEPGGSPSARVFLLGAYPAATTVQPIQVASTRMMLPTGVEATSFEPASASGSVLDSEYLRPLGLARGDVLITDIVPYFLANTTPSSSGRSMADNIRLYEEHSGEATGIERRPEGNGLVEMARTMPGNFARLESYFRRARPRLVITLGAEAAAFVRGEQHADVAKRVDELFYGDLVELDVVGHRVRVVHFVHPHLFIKRNPKWIARHHAWSAGSGRVVRELAEAS